MEGKRSTFHFPPPSEILCKWVSEAPLQIHLVLLKGDLKYGMRARVGTMDKLEIFTIFLQNCFLLLRVQFLDDSIAS